MKVKMIMRKQNQLTQLTFGPNMFHLIDKSEGCTENNNLKNAIDNVNGKIGVPVLLYFLGVPGVFVIIIWAFFFSGK